jgi:hypothetical protein
MINYNAFMIRSTDMKDCTKAAALVDWIYWTQVGATHARSLALYPSLR